MLALRIIATILMGISCLTAFFKNISIFADEKVRWVVIPTIYGWLWRAFIIVVVWLL